VSATAPRAALLGPTIALLLGVFAVGSEALVISPLLEDIASDLGTSLERAGLSVSVYGLAVAIVAPSAGVVADRIGRRATILLGLAIFAVAGVLCAVAPTLGVLIGGRALCGVGAGLFLPAAYTWVGDEVPYEIRAQVMGRVIAGWAAALVLGVPLGGLIGQVAGWRESLAAMALLALAAAAFAVRMIPAGSGAARRTGARSGFADTLRVPGVSRLLTVNLLDMLAFYGIYTYLGTFIRDEFDVRSGAASGLILLYGVGVALTTFNGRVLDRIGKERALTITLVTLSAILVVLPATGGSVVLLGAVLLIFGTQQSAFLTSMATVMTERSQEARGTAVALMSCTSYIGVTLGAAIMGPIFTGPGYWLVGVSCAGLCLAAAAVSARTIAVSARTPS
jgi:MFS transporter, DHA1 family, inner membrane transport protein